MLKLHDLAKFAPRPSSVEKGLIWDSYVNALVEHGGDLCAEFGIDTALELQHFMAQIAHESGGFTVLWESGAYSVEGLLNIFGEGRHSARVTRAEAERLCALRGEAKAKAIFERVYGLGNPKKAIELGNIEPGDGYKYRGFGPMQITGRRDHETILMGDHSPRGALRAAFVEWDAKNCNELAARDDIKSITKRINGGYNGFESRKKYLKKAKAIWPKFPGADEPVITPTEIVQVSTKAKALDAAAKVSAGTAVAGAIVETADPLAKATEHITAVNGFTAALGTFAAFVKSHAVLGLIVLALAGWFFGRHIIKKIIADYKSGRYTPSGQQVAP